jgi:hypothetical protein
VANGVAVRCAVLRRAARGPRTDADDAHGSPSLAATARGNR